MTADPLTRAAPGGDDPAALVRRFLEAMERRDLPAARHLLAPDFAMTFPGGARFDTLEALVDWARPRYRFVRKRHEGADVAPAENGTAVWCYGTLEGEWPDGTAFAGIRFVDRFLVRDGRLVDQRVWNDLAEARRA